MTTRLGQQYEQIGGGYARTRREDPRTAEFIRDALGGARTVVNVGAGAGSYEPRDRHMIAIEPSDVMAAQRPEDLAPALIGTAGHLPLRDGSVDAAMAILTVHHWDSEQEKGVRELVRVARDTVVILTFDPVIHGAMWLIADYMPESGKLDIETCPSPERIVSWLDGDVRIHPIETARDTPDWTLGSFWAHPERVLNVQARQATSGFARMNPSVISRVVEGISNDLSTGAWDDRYGHLRHKDAFDVGLRLIVAHL